MFGRCKIVFLGRTSYSVVQTLSLWDVSFSAELQTFRQTDRQTDIIMPIADRTARNAIA